MYKRARATPRAAKTPNPRRGDNMQRQVVLAAIFCILHQAQGDTEVTKNVTPESDTGSTKVKRGIFNEYGGQIYLDQIPRQTIHPKPQFHFGPVTAYSPKYFAPQQVQYPFSSDKLVLQQLNSLPQHSYGNQFLSTHHNNPQTSFQLSSYEKTPFQINPHQNIPLQNSPIQKSSIQNSPYLNNPYQQHYVNLQERPNFVIGNTPFSAALKQLQAPIPQQERSPTVMVHTSQTAPGNHVRTEIISQTIVNTPPPVVHTYGSHDIYPLQVANDNKPNSDKDTNIPNMGLITHHYTKPKQHIIYQYSTTPEGKSSPARPASSVAKAPEQAKAVAPQYYKPQVFPNPIVSQIQHFLPTPYPFSTIHDTVPQHHSSNAQNDENPREDIKIKPHNSPKAVSHVSIQSSPQESAKNKPYESVGNPQYNSNIKAPHNNVRNEPHGSPRNVPRTSYESSKDVPYEKTKNSLHDNSKKLPYETDSKFRVVEGPKEERHEMREQIKAEMFHEEDNDEETFEKAYKHSARGFPAYHRDESADNAQSLGFTPYEGSYGGNYDHASHHSDDKGSNKNTHSPYPYDSYEPGYKNPYHSEYEKYKPTPYDSHDENSESHKAKSSEYKEAPDKQSWYSHEDKDSDKPDHQTEKQSHSGYTKTYSGTYTKPTTSHSSEYRQFAEPNYQYGFEPIVAEKSSTTPVWEDSEHAPNNMKKLYKENWYISKMSTSGAA